MTPERSQGEFILDDHTVEEFFGQLVTVKSIQELHEEPLLDSFVDAAASNTNPYGGNQVAWKALNNVWNLIYDHLAFNEQRSPGNRTSFVESFGNLKESVKVLQQQDRILAEKITSLYNAYVTPLLASHEFLLETERNAEAWQIRPEEQTAGEDISK